MFINGGQSEERGAGGGELATDHIGGGEREETGSAQGRRRKEHMGTRRQLHSMGQPRGLLRR